MNRKKSENFQRKSQHLIRYQKANKLKQLGFTASWNINDHKKQYNALQDPYANRYFRYQSVKMHIKQLKRSLGKVEKNDTEKKKLAKLIKQKLSDHLPAIKVAAQTYNISKDDISRNNINKSQVSKSLVKDKSISEIGISIKRKSKSKNKQKLNTQKRTLNMSVQPVLQSMKDQTQQKERSETNKQNNRDIHLNSQKKLIDRGMSKDDINAYNDVNSEKGKKSQNRKQAQRKQYLKKQQQILHKKKHQDFISFIAKKKQILETTNT